ncbi:hypothetical protein PCASD_23668 [Puccinia coronata f. sp. avenae]|uniref:HMA domain-containing protein n=1 Tax=Puccinia coronata f. sp. avenae TaxID=200324 RepID=A0A2N5TL25_9BASI|nr:hypothetical protein PCASD_23668 [Puccinia coronata f. sp. avenae]
MIQIDHIQMKLDKGPGTCIRPILEAHLDQNVKTDTAYLTTDQPPTLPGVLLKVDGMTCFPCSSSVETQFKKLKGIHFVSVALMASFWNFAPKGEDNRDEICFFATRADADQKIEKLAAISQSYCMSASRPKAAATPENRPAWPP